MKYEKIELTPNYSYKIFTFKTESTNRFIPAHWHESAELLYCIQGVLQINMNNNVYSLNPGDMIFINSNIVHTTHSPIEGDFLAIQFPLEYLKKTTEDKYSNEFVFKSNKITLCEEMNTYLRFVSENYKKDDFIKHILVKSKMYKILAFMCEDLQVPISSVKKIKSTKHIKKMEEINHYILANYLNKISIVEVANSFGYNPSYFSRYYKNFMGINFTDYLNSIRLDKAFRMLRDTDQNILDISNNSGFSNVKTFYNVFSKKFGLSPQQYRKKYFEKSN